MINKRELKNRLRSKLEAVAGDYKQVEPIMRQYQIEFKSDWWMRRYVNRNFKFWLDSGDYFGGRE